MTDEKYIGYNKIIQKKDNSIEYVIGEYSIINALLDNTLPEQYQSGVNGNIRSFNTTLKFDKQGKIINNYNIKSNNRLLFST
jgi:hypothetical protein